MTGENFKRVMFKLLENAPVSQKTESIRSYHHLLNRGNLLTLLRQHLLQKFATNQQRRGNYVSLFCQMPGDCRLIQQIYLALFLVNIIISIS